MAAVTAADARELTGSTYLTRDEAAQILGVRPKTLRGNQHTGPVYYKFFNNIRYELADVLEWRTAQLAERRQGWYPTVDRTYVERWR